MTVENNKSSQPTNVLFYGRTLKEYVSMFDIELSAWQGCKILDCPAGPASFVEEARQQGLDVIGCDLASLTSIDCDRILKIKFYPNLSLWTG
jgi:hypothetical protein